MLSKGFEIETEMTIHALDKNMHMENVVISYRDRPEGSESKLNTYSDGLKVMKTIVKLFKNYRPYAFFGYISLILLLLAAIMFIPVLLEYVKTGLVPRFPTLIISGVTGLAALQSYFSGLILNVIKENQKQQFEITLNQCKQFYDMQKREE